MRINKIYFFANSYPYGLKEVYAENELKIISGLVSEAHIFPGLSEGEMRTVPPHVIVHAISTRNSSNSFSLLLRNLDLVIKAFLHELFVSGVKIFLKYFRSNLSAFLHALRLAERIEGEVEDISSTKNIFYSFWMNNWALALSVLKYRKKISKFIFRVHGYDLYDYLRPDQYIPFRKFNMEMCDEVYTVCIAAADYLKSRNIFPEKVKMSHLGVFDNGINPFSENGKFTIVSCSAFNTNKNVDKIPDVLRLLGFPVRWVHFGGNGDRITLEDMQRKCVSLPANVEWELRGEVSNGKLMEFYKTTSVNLFLHLTFSEGGVPLVLQEAASFGVPLMGTNTGGVPEIVNDQTGILLEKDFNIQDVALGISKFRGSNTNSPAFRDNVRKFWQLHFNADVNYRKFFQQISSD